MKPPPEQKQVERPSPSSRPVISIRTTMMTLKDEANTLTHSLHSCIGGTHERVKREDHNNSYTPYDDIFHDLTLFGCCSLKSFYSCALPVCFLLVVLLWFRLSVCGRGPFCYFSPTLFPVIASMVVFFICLLSIYKEPSSGFSLVIPFTNVPNTFLLFRRLQYFFPLQICTEEA